MFVNRLAWVLATCPESSLRSGAEAVRLAQCEPEVTQGQEPSFLGTLAAAYAEAGDFSRAIEVAERAVTLASGRGDRALADALARMSTAIEPVPRITRYRRLSRRERLEPGAGDAHQSDTPCSAVEDGREEDTEQSDTQHAAKDGRAQRLPHFRPALGQRERHHAQNESQRGHHDGAEPQGRGLDGGCHARHALLVLLLGKLYDQHRILHASPVMIGMERPSLPEASVCAPLPFRAFAHNEESPTRALFWPATWNLSISPRDRCVDFGSLAGHGGSPAKSEGTGAFTMLRADANVCTREDELHDPLVSRLALDVQQSLAVA